MNIFILDRNPIIAARMLCDRHIVNQPRESMVMLDSRGWHNHPCTVWTFESKQNYIWHLQHALEMCDEYTRRYDREHACQEVFEWLDYQCAYFDLPSIGLTPFAEAVADIALEDTVKAYREYYRVYKSWAVWKHSEEPYWWLSESLVN